MYVCIYINESNGSDPILFMSGQPDKLEWRLKHVTTHQTVSTRPIYSVGHIVPALNQQFRPTERRKALPYLAQDREYYPRSKSGGCNRVMPNTTRVLCEKAPPLRVPIQSEPHNRDQTSHGDQGRVAPSPPRSPSAAASSAVPCHRKRFTTAPERHSPQSPGALLPWSEPRSATTATDFTDYGDYGEITADFTEYGNYDEVTAVG